MSNNIYDILKKFNNLDSVKNMLNEGKAVCKSCGKAKCKCVDESKGSKPDFLDMDKDGDKKEPMKKAAKEKSKGAVAEAVAQVEQQLNEKYMGFKKTAAAVAKGGSAKDPEAVAASIGRKKYGKEKFQKAAAAGKKLGEDGMDEDVLTPKQKKFAKLAPPPDKITYADKIAGAKKTNEGFPTVDDAKKRMDDREGKTSHGKKTATKTGLKHERDYDAVDKGADVDTTPKGRGRPKKDRFA